MRPMWWSAIVCLAAVVSLEAGQQQKAETKPVVSVKGTFTGRSGKPMAGAHLSLGEVIGDKDFSYARVRIVSRVREVITDAKGQFEFKGVPAGTYTIVYQPGGMPGILIPVEFGIRSFNVGTQTIAPGLRNVELGKNDPLPDKKWGQEYTLIKGHTFWSDGSTMKVWNATARKGAQGPFIEIRKGIIWQDRFDGKSEIKFSAWSF